MSDKEETLISHLEALRGTLLRCFAATGLLFPLGCWAAPHLITLLVRHCFPEGAGTLHYFAPLEVFMLELKLGFVIALVLAYPWNITQLWKFLLPALYASERRALGWWIVFSSLLFFGGVFFCSGAILPLLMNFSAAFATPELRPLLGVSEFLALAGWLSLAFGIVFQAPVVVMLAVRFGVISVSSLRRRRPYIITAILVIAALLTPPDVISQLMMALPCWLLFEAGLLFASGIERARLRREAEAAPDADPDADSPYDLDAK